MSYTESFKAALVADGRIAYTNIYTTAARAWRGLSVAVAVNERRDLVTDECAARAESDETGRIDYSRHAAGAVHTGQLHVQRVLLNSHGNLVDVWT